MMKFYFILFVVFNVFSSIFAFTGHFFLFVIAMLFVLGVGIFCYAKFRKEIQAIAFHLKNSLESKQLKKFVLYERDDFAVLKGLINNLFETMQPLLYIKNSALNQIKKIIDVMDFPVILLSYSGKIVLYNKSAEFFLRIRCDNCFYFEVVKNQILSNVIGKCLNADIKGEEFGVSGRVFRVSNFRDLALTGEKLVLCLFEDVTSEREKEKFEREFISAVSHELKTPLSVINSSADIFLDTSVSEAEKLKFAELLKQNAERMNDLVKKLLVLTEIRSGKRFKKERINMKEIAELVSQSLRGKIREKRLLFEECYEDVEVVGNRFLLIEMLNNVLHNAVKYTDKGKVVFSVSKENSFAVVRIRDTGRGMKENTLLHIFEPFYREDFSRARLSGGTGLGLTIAKRVAHLHGGNITVKSKLGEGTEFLIQIPAAEMFGILTKN